MSLYEIPNRDRTIDSEAEAYYGTGEDGYCEQCAKAINQEYDRDAVDLTLSTGTGRNLKMRLVKFCNDACWSRAMWEATQAGEEQAELRKLAAALQLLSTVKLSRMPTLNAYGNSGWESLIRDAGTKAQQLAPDGYEVEWTARAQDAVETLEVSLG